MNLSRFFKTPQPLLPKFSFQDLQNSASRARLSKSQFVPRQHHIFDLILVFMAALIEGDIALANQRLGELETCSPEEIRRIFHECEVEAGCVSVLTKFPSSTNFSGRVIWGLLNQFLQQYSVSYHKTLLTPGAPEVTKTLHKFDYAKEINPNVQVDCFVRKKWRWQEPQSRDHEMGPRITKGFEYGGWKSRYFDVSLEFILNAKEGLSKNHPRVCIFDIEFAFLNLSSELDLCLDSLQKNYDVKIAVLFDAWQPQTKAMIEQMMPYFDFIWCPMPTSMNDLKSVHQGRSIIFPFPQGVAVTEIERIRSEYKSNKFVGFSGGVGLANPSRLNWLASIASYGGAEIDLSTNHQTVQNPMEDYIRYLDRLSQHSASLNFSLRYNNCRVATGRGFEIPLVGGLLLQEYAEDMHEYLVPGEHFLEFLCMEELISILDKVQKDGVEYKKIAIQGVTYLDSHYSDKKVVEFFSTLI
jgi:hypothetical protein